MKSRIVHFFSKLTKCLASLGQLCDSKLKIMLTKEKIHVQDDITEDTILQGERSPKDGMWYLEFSTSNNKKSKIRH